MMGCPIHGHARGRRLLRRVDPGSVNGSIETIVDRGVARTAELLVGFGAEIARSIPNTTSPIRIRQALDAAAVGQLDDVADQIAQSLMHAVMLGALDNAHEVETNDQIKPAVFVEIGSPDFLLAVSGFGAYDYQTAVDRFLAAKPLTRKVFDALGHKARLRAFTVAGAAKRSIVRTVQRELARQVARGASLEHFAERVVPRLKAAGWMPKNPSHIENVFRTNIQKAYSAGKVEHAMKPSVLKARPVWTWQGVQDGPPRQRDSHNKAHGLSMMATNREWMKIYAPAGWNCRCTVRTSKAGTPVVPSILAIVPDLVDKGFTAGIASLISPDFGQGGAAAEVTPPVPEAPEPAAVPIPTPETASPPVEVAPYEVQGLPVAEEAVPEAAPVLEPPEPPQPPEPIQTIPDVLPTPTLPVAPVVPEALVPIEVRPSLIQVPEVDKQAANILGEKIESAKGSNEGGIYRGLDGVDRYVKFYTDPVQAPVEHLTNQIYSELGLGKLKSQVFTHPETGRTAYASDMIPGAKQLGDNLTKARARKVFDGFAADVLTANWDAAGLNVDNLIVDPKGKLYRIDNGGSLIFRAKAGRKPAAALSNPSEWESFFNPSINPGYAKVANKAGYSSVANARTQVKKGIERILKLEKKYKGWGNFIEKHAPGLPAAERTEIQIMLERRSQFLEEKLREMEARELAGPKRTFEELEVDQTYWRRSDNPIPGVTSGTFDDQARVRLESISWDQRQAIIEYTGSEYSLIREAAHSETFEDWKATFAKRGSSRYLNEDMYRDARKKALHIEETFVKLEATATTTIEARLQETYRGVRNLPESIFADVIDAKEITLAGPTSTSWKADVAESFAGGDRAVMFVIRHAPGDARNRIAIKTVSAVRGEEEVLLRRGARYRVVDVKKASGTGTDRRAHIYLEEIIDAPPSGDTLHFRRDESVRTA
jgi:hypothetical protein